MTKTVQLRLIPREVAEAIKEYCINTTGLIGDDMRLKNIQVDGMTLEAKFTYVDVEFESKS
jgi:hypothetical protein